MDSLQGKTISVPQVPVVSEPGSLIASIKLRSCEYTILEVPKDSCHSLFHKLTQFLPIIRTHNAVIVP